MMITPAYAQVMARYNTWQNINIYDAASRLDDSARKCDRGAFFRSIHATLNHLLWADLLWLSRFGAGEPPPAKTIPEGLTMVDDFGELRARRVATDAAIEAWAHGLKPQDLEGDLVFHSASFGQTLTKPRAVIAMQIFNHQTHHRGQVHALLTGLGIKPDVTDLPMNPDLWAGHA